MSDWQELRHNVTKLRHKVDNLDKAWDRLDTKLNELVQLAETARLITYGSIILVMVVLLVKHFG